MSSLGEEEVAAQLDRARQGDDGERERLFASSRSYLGILARAQVETWLRVKVDPSDLVQQTLLEAHRDFARFQGRTQGEWLAWLKRILCHNAADFVRHYNGTDKRQAKREVRFEPPPGRSTAFHPAEPAAAEETPSQQLIRRDNQLEVAAAVAELPPDYREVILLRNLQRLPFDEVARRMGRSRPAVQMLWMRAVKKLQQRVASTEGGTT